MPQPQFWNWGEGFHGYPSGKLNVIRLYHLDILYILIYLQLFKNNLKTDI